MAVGKGVVWLSLLLRFGRRRIEGRWGRKEGREEGPEVAVEGMGEYVFGRHCKHFYRDCFNNNKWMHGNLSSRLKQSSSLSGAGAEVLDDAVCDF